MGKTLCPETGLLSYGCFKIPKSSFFGLRNHLPVRILILEVTKLSLFYYLVEINLSDFFFKHVNF